MSPIASNPSPFRILPSITPCMPGMMKQVLNAIKIVGDIRP